MSRQEAMAEALRHIIDHIDIYVLPTCDGSNSVTVTIDEKDEVAITTGAIDRPFLPITKWHTKEEVRK